MLSLLPGQCLILIYSFNLNWGNDTEGFLFSKYLNLADTPGQVGSLVPGVFIPLLIVWVITLGVLIKGIKRGIEVANKIMLPALLVLFIIIVIRAVTLEGAVEGLNAFFKPNWEMIFNGKVWVAAYGQIFFSLSIGYLALCYLLNYLPRNRTLRIMPLSRALPILASNY